MCTLSRITPWSHLLPGSVYSYYWPHAVFTVFACLCACCQESCPGRSYALPFWIEKGKSVGKITHTWNMAPTQINRTIWAMLTIPFTKITSGYAKTKDGQPAFCAVKQNGRGCLVCIWKGNCGIIRGRHGLVISTLVFGTLRTLPRGLTSSSESLPLMGHKSTCVSQNSYIQPDCLCCSDSQ